MVVFSEVGHTDVLKGYAVAKATKLSKIFEKLDKISYLSGTSYIKFH